MNLKMIAICLAIHSSIASADNIGWFSDAEMSFDKQAKSAEKSTAPQNSGTKIPKQVTDSAVEAVIEAPETSLKPETFNHGSVFRVRGYSAELITIRPLDDVTKKGLSPHECKDLFVAEFRPDSDLRKAILKEMQFPAEANGALPDKLRWIFGGRKGCFSRNARVPGQEVLESLDAALRKQVIIK